MGKKLNKLYFTHFPMLKNYNQTFYVFNVSNIITFSTWEIELQMELLSIIRTDKGI